MALLLQSGKVYISDTGAIIPNAYLRINPIGINNKDAQTQEFMVYIYNSKNDKRKRPVASIQVTVTGLEYTSFFSPVALLSSPNIQSSAYDYLLFATKCYQEEQNLFNSLPTEESINFVFKYKNFDWSQGDIWVSDEV